jgi:hypothetical protein
MKNKKNYGQNIHRCTAKLSLYGLYVSLHRSYVPDPKIIIEVVVANCLISLPI